MKSKSSKSTFRTGMVSAFLATCIAFSALGVSASAADDRQQADQKRAQEKLDVVSELVERHMYDAALSTISGMENSEDIVLSDKQSKQLVNLQTESQAGAAAQAEVAKSFAAIDGYLADDNYAAAVAELDSIRAKSEYLDADRAEGLKKAQASVAALGKTMKNRMKTQFAKSKEYYKQGDLNEAKIGFGIVSASGVELSFLDRGGDFATADTYLTKIAEKEAAQATGQPVAELNTEATGELAQQVAVAQAQESTVETELAQAVEPTVAPDVAVAADVKAPTPATTPAVAKTKKSIWPFGISTKLSQADAQQVEKLLAYGDLAMSKKKYEQAREYFLEALKISPENETAKQYLTVAEYHISRPIDPKEAAKLSIIEKVKQDRSLQIQAIKSNWVNTRERSSTLVAEGKYTAALSEIVKALASIESNKQLLGDDVYTSLKTEAEKLRDQVSIYSKEALAKSQEEQIRAAEKLQSETAEKAERERSENISKLFAAADQFAQQRQFQSAINTMDHVLTIDPSNETAKFTRNSYEQLLIWQQQHDIAREGDRNVVTTLVNADRGLVPPLEKMEYPTAEEWRKKEQRVPKAAAGAASKAQTLAKIRSEKISIQYDEVSLSEALDDIANKAQVVIFPQWEELDQTGITRDQPVSVPSMTVTIGKALDNVLTYVSSAGTLGKAGYKIDEEGFVVVRRVDRDYGYEFRTYYIGDLVRPTTTGGMGGGMMGGMGGYGGGMMGGMGGMGGMMGGMGGMGGMMGGMGGMGGMMGGMGGMGGMMGGMGGMGGFGFDQEPVDNGSDNSQEQSSDNGDNDMINLGFTPNSNDSQNWIDVQAGGRGGNNGGRGGNNGGGGRGGNTGNGGNRGNNGNNGGRGGNNGGNYGGMGGGTSNYSQIMELNQLIMQAVQPNTWRYGMNTNMMMMGVGGQNQEIDQQALLNQMGYGMIIPYRTTYFNIYQTPEVHQEVAEFLASLRAMQGDQVSLESRLLTINNNMLEDIGIDVDFLLSASEYGWDKWSDINVEQQHAEWASPSSSTGMTGSLGGGAVPSAFEMSGSFLDNIQVDFLIRATKANNRSRMLTAPHVTVFNGENAYINFSREFVYVSELSPVVGVGVVGYDVTTADLTSGIEMDLTPYISADKRYVQMNINFDQEILDSMFSYSYVSGDQVSTVDSADGTDIADQGNQTVRIQLPQTSVTQVETKVSVPDGGTLLLGGQKLVGEVEQESGVPGLAHIPILNRIFSTRNKTKDENVILVLIKPEIIIQSEKENDNFGSLELDQELR